MPLEEKWKANKAKVAFAKRFPGLMVSWDQVLGKTVEAVMPLASKPGSAALIFTDGMFVVVPPIDPEPKDVAEGLVAVRSSLEPRYPEAFAEYDSLVRLDRDALRGARLEKIIGAIQNNLDQIPELKDRVRRLVKGWEEESC